MSVHEHKEKATKSVRCFVITVSDTRDESTDTSGQTIKKFLADNGHQTNGYQIVKDEPAEIESLLNQAFSRSDVDAVIVNGGTGIAPRDGTYEVVSRFLEKKLDGFGEVFRYLSYLDIGSAAIMSRAAVERAQQVLISLPGSRVRSPWRWKLILPARHMVSQLQGQ
jgi:molybdenum cofactor biosynthesis protein B